MLKKLLCFSFLFFALHFASFAQEETREAAPQKQVQLISTYPNPTVDYLKLDYRITESESEVKLVIRNLLGAVVVSKTLSHEEEHMQVSVQHLKSGVYFCSLTRDNETVETRKFIVRR